MFAALFMTLVIACGGESTALKTADTPIPPTDTATPLPTRILTPTTTSATAIAPAPATISTPTPEPTRRPLAAAAPQVDYLEDAKFIRLGADPTTFDPHLTGDVRSAVYIVEVFGGLVTLDRNLEVAPDLAKDWEISNGGKTYTFHLREDAKFHNGRPVTAEDVKWSIERIADPKTESPLVAVFLGDIVGFLDKYEGRTTNVEGVRAGISQIKLIFLNMFPLGWLGL